MTAPRDLSAWLADMADAAVKARAVLGTMALAEFQADDKTAFAVIRALEILGEASKRIPPPFASDIHKCRGERWPGFATN